MCIYQHSFLGEGRQVPQLGRKVHRDAYGYNRSCQECDRQRCKPPLGFHCEFWKTWFSFWYLMSARIVFLFRGPFRVQFQQAGEDFVADIVGPAVAVGFFLGAPSFLVDLVV